MGYSDGALELSKAHASLSKMYADMGGADISSKIKEKQRQLKDGYVQPAQSENYSVK